MNILLPSLAFLGAPVASAAVIFTPLPDSPTDFVRDPVELDFDGNGSIDMTFQMRGRDRGSPFFEALVPDNTRLIEERRDDGIVGSLRRDEGFVVDSLEGRPLSGYAEHWKEELNDLARYFLGFYNEFGNVGEGDFGAKEGFLGFRFEGDEGTHYGYVEIRGHESSRFTLLSYAWESTPETAIITGAIPEPSNSLLLVLASMLLWKRSSHV